MFFWRGHWYYGIFWTAPLDFGAPYFETTRNALIPLLGVSSQPDHGEPEIHRINDQNPRQKSKKMQNNLSRMVCWWYLLHISISFFFVRCCYIYIYNIIYILLCILIYIDMLYLRIWVKRWHASLKRIHSSAQITTTYGEVVRSVKLCCFGWFISHSFKLKSIRVLPLALEASKKSWRKRFANEIPFIRFKSINLPIEPKFGG